MEMGEDARLPAEECQLPDALTMWTCIGCGAKGNFNECTGACAYRKLEVIEAGEYADLLERLDTVLEHADSLRRVVELVASFGRDEGDAEESYRSYRQQARAALRSFQPREHDGAATAEYSTIWRCASCGQIEAPQQCIGVCTRRNGEFVRAEDHEALRGRLLETISQRRKLAALVQRLAWVSPRSGQWERTCNAFRNQARELLESLSSPSRARNP